MNKSRKTSKTLFFLFFPIFSWPAVALGASGWELAEVARYWDPRRRSSSGGLLPLVDIPSTDGVLLMGVKLGHLRGSWYTANRDHALALATENLMKNERKPNKIPRQNANSWMFICFVLFLCCVLLCFCYVLLCFATFSNAFLCGFDIFLA